MIRRLYGEVVKDLSTNTIGYPQLPDRLWSPARAGAGAPLLATFGTPVRHGTAQRAILGSMFVHCAVVFCWVSLAPLWSSIFVPNVTIESFDPESPAARNYTTIYYAQMQLPSVKDAGGAQVGVAGRSGGAQSSNRQVIRVSREKRLAATNVVDAPLLVLPINRDAVANVVVLHQVAPAPPTALIPAARLHSRLLGTVAAAQPAPDASLTDEMSFIPPIPDMQLALRRPRLILPARVIAPATQSSIVSAAPIAAVESGSTSTAGRSIRHAVVEVETSQLSGLILSTDQGNSLALPASGFNTSIAMSPGGRSVGIGGSGGGGGTGQGNRPGAGSSGVRPGAGESGSGVGADPNAKGGISAGSGSGGAASGNGEGSGVFIQGSVVHLPSFSDSGDASRVVRSQHWPKSRPPAVVVIASPRAGGALNLYHDQKGQRVYTTYLDNSGTVLQFSDPSNQTEFQSDLTAPEAIETKIPSGLQVSRTLISCVLDTSGRLRNLKLLRTESATAISELLVAIQSWRFRPVLRNQQAIEVNAVLGFAIDTH